MLKLAFTLALVASALAANAQDLGWTTYSNPRFGGILRYPSEVFTSRRASEARDGVLFATGDGGAKLPAYFALCGRRYFAEIAH